MLLLVPLVGALHPTLDLVSHFPLQCLVAAVLLLPLARWGPAASRWSLWTLALALVVHAATLAPYVVPTRAPETGPGQALRILAWNVWKRNTAGMQIRQLIVDTSPDLAFLQESSPRLRSSLGEIDGYGRHTLGEYVLLVADRLESAEVHSVALGRGRALVTTVGAGHARLSILGCHLPPPLPRYADLRREQLEALAQWARTQSGAVAVIGDLNTSPFSHEFGRLLSNSGLEESGVGFGYQGTWPFHNGLLSLLRIPLDHGLSSPGLRTLSRETLAAGPSNHRPLLWTLEAPSALSPEVDLPR